MKEAIQKAIEGGYPKDKIIVEGKELSEISGEKLVAISSIFLLDPLFWQALGKAMGWDRVTCGFCGCGEVIVACPDTELHKEGTIYEVIPTWHWKMRRFIDHLAEGKDAESFFKELLKT